MQTVHATDTTTTRRPIRIPRQRRRAPPLPFSWELDQLFNTVEASLGMKGCCGALVAAAVFGLAGTGGDPTVCDPLGKLHHPWVAAERAIWLERWRCLEPEQKAPLLAYYGRFIVSVSLVVPGDRRRRPLLDVLSGIARKLCEDAGQVEIEDISGARARDQASWIARDEAEAARLRRDTRRSQDDRQRALGADARARAAARRITGAMAWTAVTEQMAARIGDVTDQLVVADKELKKARTAAMTAMPQVVSDLAETRWELVRGLHGEVRSRETAASAVVDTRLTEVETCLQALTPPGAKRAQSALSDALARVAHLEARWQSGILEEDWTPLVGLVERYQGGPKQRAAAYQELGRLKRRAEGIVREAHQAWRETVCYRCGLLAAGIFQIDGASVALCVACAESEVNQ